MDELKALNRMNEDRLEVKIIHGNTVSHKDDYKKIKNALNYKFKGTTFKAKKINSDEYVKGYYVFIKDWNKHFIFTGSFTSSEHYQEPDYLTRYEIDIDTLVRC